MSAGHPANSGTAVDINAAAAVHRNARYQPDALVIPYAGGDLTGAQLDKPAIRQMITGES